MCVGIKVEDPPPGWDQIDFDSFSKSEYSTAKQNRRSQEARKEKAKDAARVRRTRESDYFEDLERFLPVAAPPSQHTTLDKTSIIRLSVAHLKCQDVLKNGLHTPYLKEELYPDIDLFSCLDGFSLVLGSGGDVIYVSGNVCRYIGLAQFELLGQQFSDYVHPCDHHMLSQLTLGEPVGSEDDLVEIFVRVKCTMTERGRMINLKQANYKPLKITGRARYMSDTAAGGVKGTIFLGVARYVVEEEMVDNEQIGVFTSKHSVDMKFVETDHRMYSVAGYRPYKLVGVSFYELVHAQDMGNVQHAFQNLSELGQCETGPYRLLCYGGGYTWVQTKASLAIAKRGSSKGQTVSCSHTQISEAINREDILSLIQMKDQTISTPFPSLALKTKKETELVRKKDICQLITLDTIEQEAPKLMQIEKITTRAGGSALHSIPDHYSGPRALDKFSIIRTDIRTGSGMEAAHCLKSVDTYCSIMNNVNNAMQSYQSVIIKQRQTQTNDWSSFRDKKIVSSPTSVIVKCHQHAFQRPVETFEENPKSVTECIWNKSINTECIVSSEEPSVSSSLYQSENVLPITNLYVEDKAEMKENDLFDEIFSNQDDLEKLSPHCGDQCIPINKSDSVTNPTIETVNFDDLVVWNLDDNFDFPNYFGKSFHGKEKEKNMNKFEKCLKQNEKIPFDQNQICIEPNRNRMWGCDIHDNYGNYDVVQPRAGRPIHDTWCEQGSNNMDCGFTNKSYPNKTIGQKLEIYGNQEDYCFNPPEDEIVFRPKKETFHPMKRNLVLHNNTPYQSSKKFKFSMDIN